jgi:hypothetical protein
MKRTCTHIAVLRLRSKTIGSIQNFKRSFPDISSTEELPKRSRKVLKRFFFKSWNISTISRNSDAKVNECDAKSNRNNVSKRWRHLFFAYITAYTNDKILIFLKFVDKSSMNKSLLQNKYFSKTFFIIIIRNTVESTISCSFFISSM